MKIYYKAHLQSRKLHVCQKLSFMNRQYLIYTLKFYNYFIS